MKGKATVKGSNKATTGATGSIDDSDKIGYAPAVPITVYRDLAKELDIAKQKLATVTAQNTHLQKQNKALRQEVIRVIQSAATLKSILQTSHPAASPTPINTGVPILSPNVPLVPPIPGSSDQVSEELIAELDRSLIADIGQSLKPDTKVIAPKVPNGVIQGPFCEVVLSDMGENNASMPEASPEPLFTEQPTSPPNAIALEDKEKSGVLGGVWLPLTLVVVIVTAFSSGFLIMLAFRNANQNN
ncbi:MAG: hypothetical protein AAGD25_14550 [Cyanobacteria bacterium P01_F01_bin.150]